MFKENPYTFLRPDDPILQICMWATFSRDTSLWYKILSSNRLHITGAFPTSNILVRNPEGDAVRSLYLANDIVKAVIQNNDYEKIRLTTAGTKVFAKQEAGKGLDIQFRVLGEGLPVILPYIDPSSIITADIATLRILVESYYPLCSNFAEPFRGFIQELGVCYLNLFMITTQVICSIWKSYS
jgi:multisite-specific tRNA:(cytosine-C5)-methyltransferase